MLPSGNFGNFPTSALAEIGTKGWDLMATDTVRTTSLRKFFVSTGKGKVE